MRPSTPRSAAAGVRLRPRGTGGGGNSSWVTAGGGVKGIGEGTAGFGLRMAKSWDPCGVAGMTWKVGAGLAVGVGAGARAGVGAAGAGTGTETDGGIMLGSGGRTDPDLDPIGPTIRISSFNSEGVDVPCTDEDPMRKSASSSSIGSSKTGEGDSERTVGRAAGDRRMLSGTSRSRSSIWIRPRKDSSAPANRLTLPSMTSIRRLVRVVSSATLPNAFTCSSSTAIRLSFVSS
jgi:hypothetical protein